MGEHERAMRELRDMGRGVREVQVRKEILSRMNKAVSRPTIKNIVVYSKEEVFVELEPFLLPKIIAQAKEMNLFVRHRTEWDLFEKAATLSLRSDLRCTGGARGSSGPWGSSRTRREGPTSTRCRTGRSTRWPSGQASRSTRTSWSGCRRSWRRRCFGRYRRAASSNPSPPDVLDVTSATNFSVDICNYLPMLIVCRVCITLIEPRVAAHVPLFVLVLSVADRMP